MRDKLQALTNNHTWTLVPRRPHMNIVGCKWIFKTKLHADGTLDRLKARLVAKGFHQNSHIDFVDTYNPVVLPQSIRIVLTIALSHNWEIRQLDVKNTFLHGYLKDYVYMDQPPRLIDQSSPNHLSQLA